MKKLTLIVMAIVLSVAVFHSCNEPLTEDPTSDELSLKSASNAKSYIVVLNDVELNAELSNLKGYEMRQQAAKKAAEKVMKRAGITDGELGFVYGTAIKGFSVKIPPGQLKKLQDDPSVKYIEENQIITLIEPKAKPGDGDVQASAQTVPWGITRVNGGATYTGNKKAWIIDTGIDLDHPDLIVNTSLSKTFVSRTSSANDDNGHGSHVAGTVAAKNDGVGVVGVAAGAQLVAVKVLDRRGSGTTSGVIAGVDYVAANAIDGDVANMSLGGGISTTLDEAVLGASDQTNKNIFFSLAAGNSSADANNSSPARVNGDYIYTISAMDANDNFASFSNYGNPPVDFCEPGVSILSTYKDGSYATASGTSMAAPHMAGILLWGAPDVEKDESGKVITVKNDPDGNPDRIGVVGGATAPDNNPPSASFTYSASGLTVNFTDTSSDSDGSVDAWNWNFGDEKSSTLQYPSHTYAAGGTYTVLLTITDNEGATGTTSQNVTVTASTGGEITLTATGYKVKGRQTVDLVWSGATSTNIDIYRNGTLITTTANDGLHTDNIGLLGGGSYTYTVCESGSSSDCSNTETVVF